MQGTFGFLFDGVFYNYAIGRFWLSVKISGIISCYQCLVIVPLDDDDDDDLFIKLKH